MIFPGFESWLGLSDDSPHPGVTQEPTQSCLIGPNNAPCVLMTMEFTRVQEPYVRNWDRDQYVYICIRYLLICDIYHITIANSGFQNIYGFQGLGLEIMEFIKGLECGSRPRFSLQYVCAGSRPVRKKWRYACRVYFKEKKSVHGWIWRILC